MDKFGEEFKELLSICISEKSQSYSIQQITNQFPTVQELMEATEQQLIKIKGIGKGKARQISAMLKLAKILTSPKEEQYAICSPKDVFNLLESDFRYEQKEHFICLFLNTKNRLIFKEVICIGSLNAAIVHPREVFQCSN